MGISVKKEFCCLVPRKRKSSPLNNLLRVILGRSGLLLRPCSISSSHWIAHRWASRLVSKVPESRTLCLATCVRHLPFAVLLKVAIFPSPPG